MSHVNLSVEVHCDTTQNGTPVYRLYVDNDLLTERSWIWSAYDTMIEENMVVDIDAGAHQVRVEAVGPQSSFKTKNLKVNGELVGSQDLSFNL